VIHYQTVKKVKFLGFLDTTSKEVMIMEHLAELMLKVLILVLEAYNLYKLEKTLKALIESRKLDQSPKQLQQASSDLYDE
jgi:hypothetical protein